MELYRQVERDIESMTKERERKRLMVSISASLARRVEELAAKDQRPVAYMAGFLIESSVDQFGRESFGAWLRRRITSKKKKREYLALRQTADAPKERMMALVAADAIEDLEWLANAMDCTPVKLAGLLIDHGADAQAIWVKVFSSPLAQPLWWFAGGKATFSTPAEEFPEYKPFPWMKDEEEDHA